MYKKKRLVFALSLLLIVLLSIPTLAYTPMKLMVNNTEIPLKDSSRAHLASNDAERIPLRALAEHLGYDVKWERVDKSTTMTTLSREDAKIELKRKGNTDEAKVYNQNEGKITTLKGEIISMRDGVSFVNNQFTLEAFKNDIDKIETNRNDKCLIIRSEKLINNGKVGENDKETKSLGKVQQSKEEPILHKSSRGGQVVGTFEDVGEEFYRLLNEYRRQNGKKEIKISQNLESYARHRAIEEAETWANSREISHNRTDGTEAETGENLLATFKFGPKEMLDSWIKSPGHNEVLLLDYGDEYRAGVASIRVKGNDGLTYWVSSLNVNISSMIEDPTH